jgi:nitroimidazol reductase NimA-like FMN-containing flavoprotein (pyridoxamine 5'-phosphate oxidase superfamily)/GNAT superfamily N-acetyltransferase
MDQPPASPRTRVRRHPQRAAYDRATLEAILDEGWVAHVGFINQGAPFVIPTAYARLGGAIYLHGAMANQMLRAGAAGDALCATVTLLDGLVLARSAFHHSMNYRSVVIVGRAREVVDGDQKLRVLTALVERFVPGRARQVRAPSAAELAQTLLLELPLDEASAKIRTGPPLDAESDLSWPAWAGVIPLALRAARPLPEAGAVGAPPQRTLAGAVDTNEATGPRAPVVEARHADYQLSDDATRIDLARVADWLREAHWCAGIPRAAVEQSARCSSLLVGAYATGGQQVGYLRVVSDRTRFANLMDVFVAPEHRGRGLARAMVRFALGHPAHQGIPRWLLGTRDAHGVYAHEGFGPLTEPERLMQRLAPAPWSVAASASVPPR